MSSATELLEPGTRRNAANGAQLVDTRWTPLAAGVSATLIMVVARNRRTKAGLPGLALTLVDRPGPVTCTVTGEASARMTTWLSRS